MPQPRRIAQQAGRHARVDRIAFQLPVQGIKSSALMAYGQAPSVAPEGFESVIDLGQSQVWPPPATAPVPGVHS